MLFQYFTVFNDHKYYYIHVGYFTINIANLICFVFTTIMKIYGNILSVFGITYFLNLII